MASKQINTYNGTKQHMFLNLYSKVRIKDFADNLLFICKTESIPEIMLPEIERVVYNCVHSYTHAYLQLSSDKCRTEFREASKRHQRTLNSIISFILQSYQTDRHDTHVISYKNTITVKVGSITVMSEEVNPRSFRSWYNGLKLLCQSEIITPENVVVICRILTSVYNIVNEPELYQSEKDDMTTKLVKCLSATPQYTTIDDFKEITSSTNPDYIKGIQELKETVNIIKYYMSNPSLSPPKWAKDIVKSLILLSRDQRLFMFDNVNPQLSSKSTCSSMIYKNKRIPIPGLFASCIEPDYYKENYPDSKLDTIIGFNQDYCINKDFSRSIRAKSTRRSAVSIKQKKPKPRIIHPLNNSEQDRLSYYHNLLARVLSNIPSDCTFDQTKGPLHVKNVMVKEKSWSIYSLDLTSATDTFNLGLQWYILKELIFNNNENASDLSNAWLDIMTSETSIKIGRKEIKFSFSNGQPQGFLSSFPSFALEHHIVMLTVLRKFNPELDPGLFYRVLGDDSLLTCYDKSCEIPDLYQYYINSSNVECNISKGYLYNPDIPEMSVKIAEFAKYLILDGIEVTPIPTKLLVTENNICNSIGLLSWYSVHRKEQLSVENLKYFLQLGYKGELDYYSPIIDILVQLNVPNIIFNSFKRKFSRIVMGNTKEDILVIQCLLTHSIIYGVCDRLIGSKDFDNNIDSLIHFSKELKPFLEAMKDPSIVSPSNKLFYLKEKITEDAKIFSEICAQYESLSELDDETIELICLITQINNATIIKDKINNLLDGIKMLLINPLTDLTESEYTLTATRMLELFSSFNICIERSWSSLGQHLPVNYLINSHEEINKTLLSKCSSSIENYILDNNFHIEYLPVENKQTSSYDPDTDLNIGSFANYQSEDWELLF